MNIKEIVDSKKCMSCGGCSSICPVGAIDMVYEDDGLYRPHIVPSLCKNCGLCKKICPALHQDASTLIGEYRKIYLAHATSSMVRCEATSGGVINALARYLIDQDIVDGVVMTIHDEKSEIEARPVLITKDNIKKILEKPREYASRYVSVPVLSVLKDSAKDVKRIALVGTPCQMLSLSLLGKNFCNVEVFKIGITCSGGMSYKATEEYKRIQKMKKAKMYYRGNGWPGKNSLISDDQIVEFNHSGSLFERMFSSQIFKNPGCRNCKDHFAEKADISFCDFWNEQERKNETLGNSCVIIRNSKAQNIFENMLRDGYVEVVRELTEIETVNTQMHVLKAKKGNLHNKMQYRFFMKLVDFIFQFQIYKVFRFRIYQRFCLWYRRMCERSRV